MTDAQIITVAIALIASLGALVYNNSRLTNLKDTVNGRFKDVNRHIDDKFALLSQQMKAMEENPASYCRRPRNSTSEALARSVG